MVGVKLSPGCSSLQPTALAGRKGFPAAGLGGSTSGRQSCDERHAAREALDGPVCIR